MKKFIKDYLKIIAFTVIGLMLMVSGFYIMMNYYHSQEVKTTLYINQNDLNYQNYQSKLAEIKANLNSFQSKNSTNSAYRVMYNKLLTCHTVMSEEGTFATIPVNTYLNSYDIYELGNKFQSYILNVCWALHLSYLNSDNVPKEFKNAAPYVTNSINNLTYQVDFALAEIQNNSSYFYTTNITSSTIRNYLMADYSLITNSYNDFADIILNLSKTINQNGNGGVSND